MPVIRNVENMNYKDIEGAVNSLGEKVCCLQGVQCRTVLVVNFFVLLKFKLFCLVVFICDLVHDVEVIFHLPNLLTTSGNLFWNMSDACETARALLIFQEVLAFIYAAKRCILIKWQIVETLIRRIWVYIICFKTYCAKT